MYDLTKYETRVQNDTAVSFLSHEAWGGLCDVTEDFLESLFKGTLFSLASSHLKNIQYAPLKEHK